MRLINIIITFIMFCTSLFSANAQYAHYDALNNDSTKNISKDYIYSIGFDNNFPPFEYLNDDGILVGFNVDLITEAMHRLNYKFVKVHYEWNSLLSKFKSDEVDMLAGIMHSHYFIDGIRYGIPYCQLSLGIISRNKENDSIDENFLKNKTILVQNKGWAHSYLVEHNITKSIITYDNLEDAIEHYMKGEGDYIFASDLVAENTLSAMNDNSLHYKNSVFKPVGYSFAVANNREGLLYDLNKVLYEMKLDGTFDKIYSKWFSVVDDSIHNSIEIGFTIAVLLLCILLIGVAFILHIRIRKASEVIDTTKRNLEWAMEAGKVSAWVYSISNNSFSMLYGEPIVGDGASLDEVLQHMHPNDAFAYRRKLTNLIDGIEPECDIVVRYRHPNNNTFYYLDHRMHIYTDPKTHQRLIIGMRHNITAETVKQMETETLRKGLDFSMQKSNISAWVYDFITGKYRMLYGKVDFRENTESLLDDEKKYGLVHPDDLDLYKTYINDIIEGKKPQPISLRVLKNTEYHHYELCITDVRDEDGSLLYMIGAMKDYTDMYNLNKEIQNLYYENASILQNLPIGVSIFEYYGKMLYYNDICTELFNGHVINLKDNDVYLKDMPGMPTDVYNKIMKFEEVTFNLEIPNTSLEEGTKHIEFKAKYIKDTEGNVSKIVILFFDTTDRVLAMEKIKNDRDEAENSNKLKSAFLANMSHEIRTPLNAIVGFSNLLVDTTSPEEKSTYIDIINANSDLLLKLISDILDLSKIEAGFVELKNAKFDLAEAFKEISMVMEQRAVNPDVKFSAVNPYASCVIDFDRSRLTQIITNFCTNAIKYTPEGFITMGYEFVDGGIRVYVTDSGIGISDEKKDKVFMRFQKLDDFAQGTGLGLSICKAIAETAGGKVGFDSVYGEGSTFWAWIPVEAQITNESDAASRFRSAGKPNILIADSDDNNISSLTKLFSDKYIIDIVENGADAVYNLQTKHYDVVIMNVFMDIMSGIEAIQALRTFDKSTPAIAYAYGKSDESAAALELGFNKLLIFPDEIESLPNSIEDLLK